jgi:hypothetical protein
MLELCRNDPNELKIFAGNLGRDREEKLLHPKVVKVIQQMRNFSPGISVRDEYQPLRGKLRKKLTCTEENLFKVSV